MGRVTNWDELNATVREIATNGIGVREAMAKCESSLNANQKKALWAIDFENDMDRLTDWLQSVLVEEPPDASVIALMFGLAELVDDRGGERAQELYVSGSDVFDAEDEACDWAAQPVYFPKRRYTRSSAVTALMEMETGDAGGSSLTGELLTAAYAVSAVREVCDRLGPETLLICSGAEVCEARAIAVGHDEGGAWVLGIITTKGWMMAKDIYIGE